MKTLPYLAFSELTKHFYIVHGKDKIDVTKEIESYAQSAKAEAWEEGFEAGKSWERKQIVGKESNPYKS